MVGDDATGRYYPMPRGTGRHLAKELDHCRESVLVWMDASETPTLIDTPGLGRCASEFGEMPATSDLLRGNHLDEVENLGTKQSVHEKENFGIAYGCVELGCVHVCSKERVTSTILDLQDRDYIQAWSHWRCHRDRSVVGKQLAQPAK